MHSKSVKVVKSNLSFLSENQRDMLVAAFYVLQVLLYMLSITRRLEPDYIFILFLLSASFGYLLNKYGSAKAMVYYYFISSTCFLLIIVAIIITTRPHGFLSTSL